MAVVVLVYVGSVGIIIATYYTAGPSDDGLAEWVAELETLDPELMPHTRDTTTQTCTEDLPCRWALTSDTAVVMMFNDNPAACHAADPLPDAYWRDQVAVRLTPGALTQEQQDDLLIHIDTYYKRYYWRTSEQGTPDPLDPWALEEDQSCPS
ncbi:hypothetical protein D4740_10600 [Actinomyces sp. 2119]|nr:hypothetical protein D4740_10600 [Actinomyces sp. 2119]